MECYTRWLICFDEYRGRVRCVFLKCKTIMIASCMNCDACVEVSIEFYIVFVNSLYEILMLA